MAWGKLEVKPGLTKMKPSAKGSLRNQKQLLLDQITALQQAGRWRDVKPALDLFVCSKMRSILARARQLY
jgi:hypothetical protein